eukprot:CAMPEP_0171690946 /NCGR_PEP_ID=MMETSP0991-20121206/5265_1 /TAXON_ID=483369 /ORGANISM="non described non described, Strain CCMP2098" /LENGTH=142 /DNA_ID=CAMNT_0012279119 /DNA_START=233 /DNA_END=662 /DNA_ORIENTATION=+
MVRTDRATAIGLIASDVAVASVLARGLILSNCTCTKAAPVERTTKHTTGELRSSMAEPSGRKIEVEESEKSAACRGRTKPMVQPTAREQLSGSVINKPNFRSGGGSLSKLTYLALLDCCSEAAAAAATAAVLPVPHVVQQQR